MYLVPGFIVALLLTMLMLPLLIRFALCLGLVDHPGERKVHSDDIPRSGGLAIAIAFSGAVLMLLPLDKQLQSLYSGAMIVVIFALLDDRHGLTYQAKFFGQIIAVLVLMHGGILIEHLPLMPVHYVSPPITYGLTFLFLLGSINAVNLSDGLDGLAAGISLLGLSLLILLAYQCGNSTVAFLAMALAGGLIGFLRYNTYPARVFLGDTGSQFIGLMLASLAIMLTQSSTSPYSPMLPLLVLGLPIMDTLSVMAIRLYRGVSPFAADSRHIHHQILALGFYHYEVVALLYLLQIILVLGAYALRFQSDALGLAFYCSLATIVLGAIAYGRSRKLVVRSLPDTGLTERRNLFFRKFEWFYQCSTWLLQAALAVLFLLAFFYVESIDASYARLAQWEVAILLAVCVAMLKYPRQAAGICTYMALITVVYMMAVADAMRFSHWLIDGYLVVILGLLALAIRMTRRTEFRLDTRDLLVLFLVLVASQLPIANLGDMPIGRFALRLAILLYAGEYLLNNRDCNYWFMSAISVVVVALFAWCI